MPNKKNFGFGLWNLNPKPNETQIKYIKRNLHQGIIILNFQDRMLYKMGRE